MGDELGQVMSLQAWRDDRAALGRAVSRARNAAGLSQDGLAALSGVAPAVVLAMEASFEDCSLEDLHAIAHALAIPLHDLITPGGTDRPT